MFEQPRYIQNSFSVLFPRQKEIRRRANEFEDMLKKQYFQPQIIPVPDDLDPEVPRMIFGSEHGFSQIIVSQISIVLSANYSPDWQLDITKGKRYLLDRLPMMFDLLALLNGAKSYFCGLTTRVDLVSQENDVDILDHLVNIFIKENQNDIDELQLKTTRIIDNRFYSNITVQNYRLWKFEEPMQGVMRLPQKEASERGIKIVGDFNDRFSFNEKADYFSSMDCAREIIENGLSEMDNAIFKIKGA
jgi:hypothetical protein